MFVLIVRKTTRRVPIGRIAIGGGEPIAIQSMLSARSDDVAGNVQQAVRLEQAGCQILRVSIPDKASLQLIEAIKSRVSIPLVADIHFDYRLAVEAAAAGVDKIRINPGNIGSDDRVKQVVDACRLHNIAIRIGVNSGSVEKPLLEKYGGPTPEALVESAMRHVRLLERFDFDTIVVAMKSSSVPVMVQANRLMSQQRDYPLHLGVTEAGTERMGLIKSTAGLAPLLLEGIGDTLRVSLTADPVREIYAANDILKALGLHESGVDVVSCPTCGRTRIDVIALASQVEEALRGCGKKLRVAVMGCAVNGPGEAREADIGVAGGDGEGLLFREGKVIKKVPESEILPELLRQIDAL